MRFSQLSEPCSSACSRNRSVTTHPPPKTSRRERTLCKRGDTGSECPRTLHRELLDLSSVRAHLVQCVHRRLEGLSIRTVAEHDAIHRAAFHLLCRTRAVSADAIPVDRSGGVGGSEQWGGVRWHCRRGRASARVRSRRVPLERRWCVTKAVGWQCGPCCRPSMLRELYVYITGFLRVTTSCVATSGFRGRAGFGDSGVGCVALIRAFGTRPYLSDRNPRLWECARRRTQGGGVVRRRCWQEDPVCREMGRGQDVTGARGRVLRCCGIGTDEKPCNLLLRRVFR